MWDLESMGTSKTIEMCQTPWTCGAGRNKIKNSKRLLYQFFGWSFSCTRACTHTYTFTHMAQVPREEDNLKELNIFIVVSFYLKRLPKERRGWAGGAMAGDTAWNQERWVRASSSCAASERHGQEGLFFQEMLLNNVFLPLKGRIAHEGYFCALFKKKRWVSVRRVCSGVWEKLSLHTPDPRENNAGPHLEKVMFGEPWAQRCSLEEADVEGVRNSELLDKWHIPCAPGCSCRGSWCSITARR